MKISPIEETSSLIRRYIPIQSVEQLLSFVLFSGLGIGIIAALCNYFHESGALPFVIIFGLVGASPSLYMNIPARLEVFPSSKVQAGHVLDDIEKLMIGKGYVKEPLAENAPLKYSSKLPSFLKWRENTLAIERQDNLLVLNGPKLLLGFIRSKLVTLYSASLSDANA